MADQEKYTMKQKYKFYKDLATNPNAKTKDGKKMSFLGRIACANRANAIRKKMGTNKKRYDYYNGK